MIKLYGKRRRVNLYEPLTRGIFNLKTELQLGDFYKNRNCIDKSDNIDKFK